MVDEHSNLYEYSNVLHFDILGPIQNIENILTRKLRKNLSFYLN